LDICESRSATFLASNEKLKLFLISSENVRLGDHDLKLSAKCAGRNCGNPTRINEIDEIIPHESFNHRSINRKHDIGLVRLRHAVQYTSETLTLPYHWLG
jgi:hypothetical protein